MRNARSNGSQVSRRGRSESYGRVVGFLSAIREFWQVTRRSLRWSFDCTLCRVAEIPSRYRNSRPSPTVFSGYTVGPESSGLYIGGAFRPRVEPAGLPRGVARPERVLVRPDVVHWTQPGSLSDSRTGAHIQQSLGVPNRSARGRVVRFATVVRLLYHYSPLCSCSATTHVVFYCDHNLSRCGGSNVDLQPHPSCWRSTIACVRP